MNDAQLAQYFLDIVIQNINSNKEKLSNSETKPVGTQEGSLYNFISGDNGGLWQGATTAIGDNHDNKSILDLLSGILAQDSDPDRKQAVRQDFINFVMSLNQRDYDKSLLQDQRAYDYKLLQDQRAYDSPEQAINRLMAVGLSRDAALKFLNGSGTGASAIGASSPLSSPMLQGSVGNAGGSTFANYANGASSIVDSLCQLFNSGVNGFAALKSGALQTAQTVALDRQNKAAIVGSEFNSMYQKAVSNGFIDKSTIKNYDDARKALKGISKETSPEIYDYTHNGGLDSLYSTPFALDYAGQFFDSNNKYGDSVSRTKQMAALAEVYTLQSDVFLSDIGKNNAETAKLYEDIGLMWSRYDLESQLTDSTISLNESQAEANYSQIELNKSEKSYKDLENAYLSIAVHRAQITADDLDQQALYEANTLLQIAAKQNDPEVLNDTLAEIASNAKYKRSIMAFNILRMRGVENLLKQPNGKELLRWSAFYNEIGLGDLFNNLYSNSEYTFLGKKNKDSGALYEDFIYSFGIKPNRNWFTRSLKDSGSVDVDLFGTK